MKKEFLRQFRKEAGKAQQVFHVEESVGKEKPR
jgi:hypothetical protein